MLTTDWKWSPIVLSSIIPTQLIDCGLLLCFKITIIYILILFINKYIILLLLLLYWFYFETGSFYIFLVVQELTVWTRLALNSQRSSCLCLLKAGIKTMCHHTWLELFDPIRICALFWDRISLDSPGWLGMWDEDKAGLELTEIYLCLPPKC